jgi:hypothetical protein
VLWLLRFPPYGEQNIRLQVAAQGGSTTTIYPIVPLSLPSF